MDEKTMVTDTLTGINSELKTYGGMILETSNPQLKQMLKQMRNQCETTQEEIYQIARSKQYYVPAEQAKQDEVAHVKSLFTQSNGSSMH